MCRRLIYLACFVMVLGLVLTSIAKGADPSLVGWWKFDDGSGTIAKDSSGNGNDGTLVGNPQWVAGKIGGALGFDGSDDYVYIAPVFRLPSYSITLWFRVDGGTGNRDIASAYASPGVRHGILLEITTAGVLRYLHRYPLGTGGGNNIYTTTRYDDGSWYHVAVVKLPATMMLYVNGEQVGSQADSTAFAAADDPLGVALGVLDHERALARLFVGPIDDVRIYSKSLTQEEIKQTMRGEPELASNPSPANKAADIPRDVTFSWTPGEFANKHDVYFGTTFNDVNDASRTNPRGVLASFNQDANMYDPAGLLDFNQTYYWRVDEVNAPPDFTIFRGRVWQFTVEPVAYPIAGTSITATASSQFNANTKPENTIDGSGLDAADLHSTAETGVWLSSMTGPQPTWIQYEFDRIYKLHQMWVWNHNTSIEPVVGFGFKDVTIEYSTNGTDWTVLANVPQFARAPGTAGYAHNTTIDFSGVVAKYVSLTANSNWGGFIPQYGLSEVRFFYIPVFAREPHPASGSIALSVDNVTLSFRAGREAAKHNLYISSSNQAVIDETISPVSIPAGRSYISHDTGELELDKSYYWKVNEVNEAQTPTTWQGDVANFSTQKYLVVDDFEDYNDFEPDRIFDTWIDGWGVPTNGSQVGYATPPFAERTVIHGGSQSMPLSYDNSTTASYSEAAAKIANLAIGQDWTKHGIKTLSLWFYGDPNNAATEKMYVKLNGSKVTYDGDASNLTKRRWQQWNIELTSFGVNLRNVTELIIGFERSGAVGGKGVVYFDDIRLYPYSREFITPVEPNNAHLAGYWQFEGNTNDSAGANHGTATGGPTFVAGKIGQAIKFDGVDDYVNCGTAASLDITNQITVACWIKVAAFTKSWETILAKGDNSYRMSRGPQTGNSIHFGCNGPTGGNVNATAIVTDDTWHHVALVYDGSYKIIYIDGMEDARVASTGQINVSTYPLWIGNNSQQTARHLTGLVDDVRIYSRALSLAEVAWLAGRTKPFDKPF